MRAVDTILLALVGLGTFLSFQDPSSASRFERVNFKQLFGEKERERDSHFHNAPPPPLVYDLDGDGDFEVVIVSPSGLLQILTYKDEKAKSREKTFETDRHTITVKKEMQIRTHGSILRSNSAPVALGVGEISLPLSSPLSSSTVIVVVLKNWRVLCFDQSLRFMWETSIMDEHSDEVFASDVSVVISREPIHKGDLGTVFVGARSKLRKAPIPSHSHNTTAEEKAKQLEEKFSINIPPELHDLRDQTDASRHYNYIALDGVTGNHRWVHLAETFIAHSHHESEGHGRYLGDHVRKLHRISQTTMRHFGEVPWSTYSKSVAASLPHLWVSPLDTKLEIHSFHRDLDFSSSQKDRPNVLVAHLRDGIEVIHLYSGKLLLRLPLPSKTLVTDSHHDGNFELHISHAGGPKRSSHQPGAAYTDCYAECLSGNEVEWTFPVCAEKEKSVAFDADGSPIHIQSRAKKASNPSRPLELHPPILLGHSSWTGVEGGVEREEGRRREMIAYFVSSGSIVSLDLSGNFQWISWTPSVWAISPMGVFRHITDSWAFDSQQEGSQEVHPQEPIPHLVPFQLRANSAKRDGAGHGQQGGDGKSQRVVHVLAIGAEISLSNGESGSLIASSSDLSSRPVLSYSLGDFTNDGLTDLILVTDEGVVAYKLVYHHVELNTAMGWLLLALSLGLCGVFAVKELQKNPSSSHPEVPRNRSSGGEVQKREFVDYRKLL